MKIHVRILLCNYRFVISFLISFIFGCVFIFSIICCSSFSEVFSSTIMISVVFLDISVVFVLFRVFKCLLFTLSVECRLSFTLCRVLCGLGEFLCLRGNLTGRLSC